MSSVLKFFKSDKKKKGGQYLEISEIGMPTQVPTVFHVLFLYQPICLYGYISLSLSLSLSLYFFLFLSSLCLSSPSCCPLSFFIKFCNWTNDKFQVSHNFSGRVNPDGSIAGIPEPWRKRLQLMITAEEAENPENAEKAKQILKWIDTRQKNVSQTFMRMNSSPGGSAVLSSNSSHTSDEGFASISDCLDERNDFELYLFFFSRGAPLLDHWKTIIYLSEKDQT